MAKKLKPWEIFQNEFHDSFPKNISIDRLHDGFSYKTPKTVSDFVGFDGQTLIYFELKRRGLDNYLPADKLSQRNMMFQKSKYKNVDAVFVIRYDEKDETYWIRANLVKAVIDAGAKGFTYDMIKAHGNPVFFKFNKKAINVYDIKALFNDIALPF